jgi:hypothetical protein
MVRTAYFHEDDYCQVELLPVASAEYCRSEMGLIEEFADAHFDGSGFTDIYLRRGPPVPFADLRIHLSDLRTRIEPMLPSFDKVLTGYGSYQQQCASTFAWGEDNQTAVFASVGEGELIDAVWLSARGVSSERVGYFCRSLQAPPHSAELVIADWNRGDVVPLADESRLVEYLGRQIV